MKINPTGGPNFISGNYRSNKIDAYKKSQPVSSNDEATLSADALSFSKVFSEVKKSPVTQSPDELARIADIKAQVKAGIYQVDSDKIAESILGDLYG